MLRTHDRTAPEDYERGRSGHFEDRRVELVDESLRRHASLRRILEIGSGTGAIAARLAQLHPSAEFDAIELNARLRDYAAAVHPAGNLRWWSELPDRETGDVDAIYSIDVVHHLEDRAATFRQLRSLLATGGSWTVIEPNIWHPVIAWQQERMKRAGLGEDHFRPWVVEPEFAAAGFRVCSRTYAHLLPAVVRSPPQPMRAIERHLEDVRWLGGSVVYYLLAA
jgi:trans-aconitate methyltransferase